MLHAAWCPQRGIARSACYVHSIVAKSQRAQREPNAKIYRSHQVIQRQVHATEHANTIVSVSIRWKVEPFTLDYTEEISGMHRLTGF